VEDKVDDETRERDGILAPASMEVVSRSENESQPPHDQRRITIH